MFRSLSLRGLSVLLCALLLSFCTAVGTETDNPAAPEGVGFLRSSKAYLSSVEVSAPARERLQQGNRAFAVDIYRELSSAAASDENLFLSPHSISTIMAMTYAGARGLTESEMAAALHFDLEQSALHPAMNELSRHFGQVDEQSQLELRALNSIWIQQGFPVEEDYLDVLSQQYDTGVYLVDYENDAEGARGRINDWVFEQTEERIDELLPLGSVSPQSVLALTNTVYLSAEWADRFDEESTSEGVFTASNRDQITVEMMHRSWDYPFAITPEYRAVGLPYKDANISMVCVMPNEGEFEAFTQEMSGDGLLEIVGSLAQSNMLSLSIPKFEFESAVDLKGALTNLGMVDAFSEAGANFSGIASEPPPLYIGTAVHKTYIGIDEKGTVAAAATGEVLVPESINPRITLDRPFIFFIWDHDTQTVLFAGRLVRPAGPVAGQAAPPPTDAEIICGILDECEGRTVSVQECVAGLEGEDPAILEQCADCYAAEADRCGGMTYCICYDRSICADVCPARAI